MTINTVKTTAIVIDRQSFRLWLLRDGPHRTHLAFGDANRALAWSVAVGKPGDETPAGRFTVIGRSRRPDWEIPEHPDYAPETWGKTIEFGEPGNPFAGGFISLGDGIGIHGTTFPPMVGTAASHGCIRMRTPDFLRIYDRVPLGTPVVIL